MARYTRARRQAAARKGWRTRRARRKPLRRRLQRRAPKRRAPHKRPSKRPTRPAKRRHLPIRKRPAKRKRPPQRKRPPKRKKIIPSREDWLIAFRYQDGMRLRMVDFIAEGAKNEDHALKAVWEHIVKYEEWMLEIDWDEPRTGYLGSSLVSRVRVERR